MSQTLQNFSYDNIVQILYQFQPWQRYSRRSSLTVGISIGTVQGMLQKDNLQLSDIQTVYRHSTNSSKGNSLSSDYSSIRDLKQDDAFSRTWWSVLSTNKLVTWQHLSAERTGHHVVLKASSCLVSGQIPLDKIPPVI